MSRVGNLKIWIVGALLLAMVSASACGSNDKQSSSATSKSSNEENPRIIQSEGRVKGQNFCGSAVVGIGAKADTIKFVVRCTGRRKEGVAFILHTYSLENGEGLKAESYTPNPPVRGAGAVLRHGKCSMKQSSVVCNATINGPVMVSGSLQTMSDPCALEVSLVGVTYPPCPSGNCGGGPAFDNLFRGRPRGCI